MVHVSKGASSPLFNVLVACVQAISVAELYGILDPDTRDWTDGLLSNIFREINKPLLPGKVSNSLSSCCLSVTLHASKALACLWPC